MQADAWSTVKQHILIQTHERKSDLISVHFEVKYVLNYHLVLLLICSVLISKGKNNSLVIIG
jgi:hypothetical protein